MPRQPARPAEPACLRVNAPTAALVRGETPQIHEEIFGEVSYHAAYEPKRAVRTLQWKYIRHYDGRNRPNLPNCDDGPSKSLWLEHGWRDRPVEAEQLFDLTFDPNEVRNAAADPSSEPVLKRHARASRSLDARHR